MTALSWSLPHVFIHKYTPLAKLLMSFQLPRTEMTEDRNERYAKKLCLDPFADLRDGASSSEQSTVATVCTSVQDELARYKALKVPAASQSVFSAVLETPDL